jgi:hypothetical protein
MIKTKIYNRITFKVKFIDSFKFLGEDGLEIFDCKTDKEFKYTEIKTIFTQN